MSSCLRKRLRDSPLLWHMSNTTMPIATNAHMVMGNQPLITSMA